MIFESGNAFTLGAIFNTQIKIALVTLGLFALLPIVVKKYLREGRSPRIDLFIKMIYNREQILSNVPIGGSLPVTINPLSYKLLCSLSSAFASGMLPYVPS
jgi:hypothetical protein